VATTTLSGRVVFITGAGRGIGRATALAFGREGATVVTADVNQDGAEAVAEEVGNGSIGLRLDVTDRPGFTKVIDDAEAAVGPIDVFINCAGIMPVGPFDRESDETSAAIVAVNLLGVMHGTKEAMARMRRRGRGHIINVSSGAGKIAGAGGATYSATKFGVVGLSEAVSQELRGSGVQVSVVYPAVTKTAVAAGFGSPKGLRQLEPEEVADAIVAAVHKPKFNVFVPFSMGVSATVMGLVPRRVRDGLIRAMGADRLLVDFDHSARSSGYDAQAAAEAGRSEPLAPVPDA
jgi:short-subunit dehydrogenase